MKIDYFISLWYLCVNSLKVWFIVCFRSLYINERAVFRLYIAYAHIAKTVACQICLNAHRFLKNMYINDSLFRHFLGITIQFLNYLLIKTKWRLHPSRSLFIFQVLGKCHCWWTRESPRAHVAKSIVQSWAFPASREWHLQCIMETPDVRISNKMATVYNTRRRKLSLPVIWRTNR